MPTTRAPYSPEFRRQMVDLVRSGRSAEDLAREFEPTAQSISAWVAAADKQEGRREEAVAGLAASERDELVRLRRENKQLRVERDILSKAAAWFARETGAVSSELFGFMSANQACLLQLHRGLVQPGQAALRPGIPLAHGLRSKHANSTKPTRSSQVRKPSTRSGQPQVLQLTLLAPATVEAIVDGRQGEQVDLPSFLKKVQWFGLLSPAERTLTV